MLSVEIVERALLVYQNKEKALFLPKFFKTGKGEYGEGDEFLGVTVPHIRKVARDYRLLPLSDIAKLLASRKHEIRLLGTFVLVWKFERATTEVERERFLKFYLKMIKGFNNWDLVDASAHKILGSFLRDKSVEVRERFLVPLAEHRSVWHRRIALIAQYAFIKNRDLRYPLQFFKRFIRDEHELIHKGLGWMLRELGKVEQARLKKFLDTHHVSLRPVTLSYATEKLTQAERKKYYKRQGKQI